ncbi:MAG: helix-turn-helix transcriptional regulator [Bdellovibrionaceae bacterium]|nr:helix-turn-helix transcriptional regulator [Pseudobdellovibrionaceae bacterium]
MNLKRIDSAIKQKGLKKTWLAEQIHVHPSTLNRFLSGKTKMGGEALVRLFQILQIDINSLKEKAS